MLFFIAWVAQRVARMLRLALITAGAFAKTVSVTMRQTHVAGEWLVVDYAGDGVPVVIDRLTGEIRMAQIFVAVLGASSFTFAKATWTQALPDWIDAHVRAFEAIGGVPESLRRLRLSAGMRVISTGPSTEGMLLFAVVRVADVIATGRLPVASFDQSLGCRSLSKI